MLCTCGLVVYNKKVKHRKNERKVTSLRYQRGASWIAYCFKRLALIVSDKIKSSLVLECSFASIDA